MASVAIIFKKDYGDDENFEGVFGIFHFKRDGLFHRHVVVFGSQKIQ